MPPELEPFYQAMFDQASGTPLEFPDMPPTSSGVGRGDDCLNWKLLPVPQKDHLILAELCKKPFQGDPGLVLEIVDDSPKEDLFPNDINTGVEDPFSSNKLEDEKSEVIELEENAGKIESSTSQAGQDKSEQELEPEPSEFQITSGELKEEDRLAAIVHIITEETAIIPRGGLFKQTDGINMHSQAFEGLSLDEVDELCSFQHYRRPQEEWNTNLMTRVDYNYALDFLDTIDKDIPSDCWTAQLVEGDRAIVLHSLAWPGFMFFHHLQTPDYGCVYIGTGQRHLDIPFMTQVNEPTASVMESNPSVEVKHSIQSKSSSTILKQPSDNLDEFEQNDVPLEMMEETRISTENEITQ